MSKNKTIWLALITMLLWGSLYPTVKLGFSAFAVDSTADILLFAGVRFVICGAIICIFAAITDKGSYKAVRTTIWPILLSGFFAIILHYSLSYTGLELTDSSKTALIKKVGTLFYICFSFLFIKSDRPTAKKIIAAFGGFLGIVVLNISTDGFSFSIGDVLIIASSFSSVFASVISKKMFDRVSPLTSTGVSQFFGGAVLVIVGLLFGGRLNFAFDSSLLLMAYICAASTVSYCIWYNVVKSGELSKLFIIKFAEPIFACIFSAMLLNENIWQIQYLVAFVLISGSIWLSNTRSKKADKL